MRGLKFIRRLFGVGYVTLPAIFKDCVSDIYVNRAHILSWGPSIFKDRDVVILNIQYMKAVIIDLTIEEFNAIMNGYEKKKH